MLWYVHVWKCAGPWKVYWELKPAPDGGKVFRKVLAEDWAECQSKSPPAQSTVSVKVLFLYWESKAFFQFIK